MAKLTKVTKPTATSRLLKQFNFIKEIDQLKSVFRQSLLMNGEREENSAEHSWHFAMAALIFKEHSVEPFNMETVLKMSLVHDLVEIYAGDCFVYDDEGRKEKFEKEKNAAIKIFGLLPDDQRDELYNLWCEYEAQQSIEAKYSQAIDRVIPILCNLETQGHSWKKHKVPKEKVLKKNSEWKDAAPKIHAYIVDLIEDAEKKGLFDHS